MPRSSLRVVVVLAAVALPLAAATAAHADGAYHTQRIPVAPTGAATGAGTVLNIHAEGPTVYAHEVYLLKGANPGSYAVSLQVFTAAQDCTGDSFVIASATIVTNDAGNGRADHVFSPADADGLRGHTVSAVWTFAGPDTYRSACTVVALD